VTNARHVVILFHHDEMRRGKTVMRVHCVYGEPPFSSQEEATLWALRNLAPDATWAVEPLVDHVAAAPVRLPQE
jgi:hypothetical protein